MNHLELAFEDNDYLDKKRMRQLSLQTKMSEFQVKVWFQNRRQKRRKKREEADYKKIEAESDREYKI